MRDVVSHYGAVDRGSVGVKQEALVAVEFQHHVYRLSQPGLVMWAPPVQSFQVLILNGDCDGAQTKSRNAPVSKIVDWVSWLAGKNHMGWDGNLFHTIEWKRQSLGAGR
ncbi:MAG: hypothetical protein SGJ16_12600 [Nitrospirota bacterium]|nr:hypothetical protein [Nitrospirota bacterium]